MAKKNKLKIYLLAGGIFSILLVYLLNGFSFFETNISLASSWLRGKVFNRSLQLTSADKRDKTVDDFHLENQNLTKQLADLLYENASLQRLRKENEDLKLMAGFFGGQEMNRVVAQVIGHDPLLENTLVLNQGGSAGIKIGSAVVAGEGNIIGKIIDVGESQSTVLLITDSQIRLSVTKPDEIMPIGIAQGEFGLSVIVDLIPQTVELEQNELIVTGNLDPLVPPGLILGKVNRILSKENDLFKKVAVTPVLDFQNISLVSIISAP